MFRQTATEEPLFCSLKFSYALVFFLLICILHRGSKVEGFTQRNRKGKKRGRLQCRRSRVAALGRHREELCGTRIQPLPLLFSSISSRKADFTEWDRCLLLV